MPHDPAVPTVQVLYIDDILVGGDILPEQFFPSNNALSSEPEHKLCREMFEQSCKRYLFIKAKKRKGQKITKKEAHELADAEEWIASSDNNGPYAFENLCAVFHYEPQYIRRKLEEKLIKISQ